MKCIFDLANDRFWILFWYAYKKTDYDIGMCNVVLIWRILFRVFVYDLKKVTIRAFGFSGFWFSCFTCTSWVSGGRIKKKERKRKKKKEMPEKMSCSTRNEDRGEN